MRERNDSTLALPATSSQDVLTGLLRQGAQRMLAEAIDAEVAERIESRRPLRDAAGPRRSPKALSCCSAGWHVSGGFFWGRRLGPRWPGRRREESRRPSRWASAVGVPAGQVTALRRQPLAMWRGFAAPVWRHSWRGLHDL
jgi:hypothetical protein